ncbi:MAG: hypothetical protein IPK03_04945 [Bacteroidetes bacterium]|nr:hypothetical protein [Bacteroidota bacterium]
MKGALYGGSDSNSVFGNPGFISATNLRLSINATGDGKAKFISSITNDYDQKLRPAEVRDMGADDTMFIRYAAGDYTSVNCANLSGVDWINMYDTTGKLIFAINPNGNNLGSTCWSIRVRNTSDSVRKDSISNTVSGLKEYCMMLDRNLVITPTNQPTNGRVYIRFYVRQAELNKIYDTILAKWGVMLNDPWIKIHKFHQASGPEGLTPLTNAVGADSSTLLAHTGSTTYGVDKYFQYSVPGFSQQNLVIPFNNPFILPVTWTSFTAKAVRK